MTTIQTGNRRLLALANHLETIPRKQFDMKLRANGTTRCGTTACALGHACLMPKFRKLGARLHTTEYGDICPATKEEGSDASDVSRELFALEFLDHDTLFVPDYENTTPKQKAKKIRKFVKART